MRMSEVAQARFLALAEFSISICVALCVQIVLTL